MPKAGAKRGRGRASGERKPKAVDRRPGADGRRTGAAARRTEADGGRRAGPLPEVVSVSDFARLLRVDRRTVYKWRDAGMYGVVPSGIHLADALAWRIGQGGSIDARATDKPRRGVDEKRDALVDARLAREQARLEREQMQLEVLRSNYIGREQHQRERLEVIEMFMRHLLTWPAEVAIRIGQPKLKRELEACVNDVRKRIVNGKAGAGQRR